LISPKSIVSLFETNGGSFHVTPDQFENSSLKIKAIIFDWDGVFNKGEKGDASSSPFNEIDSMGTNLLRYGYWLLNKKMPITAVISGEHNSSALFWTKRECFHYNFVKFSNKTEALSTFCKETGTLPEEICYVFDDVLDLALAKIVGLRIFIPRSSNPMLNNYVISNGLADYSTGQQSGEFPVREAAELILAMIGQYKNVIDNRVAFSESYKSYIAERGYISTTTIHPL